MIAPYYQDNLIALYCADMRDIDLPTADLVLTDPPYAEETHAGARTCPDKDEYGNWRKGGNEGTELIDFDSVTVDELRQMFDRVAPSVSRWLVSFMDWRHVYHFEREPPTGLRFVRQGIWVKPNGAPQFTGDRPATGWESIAMLHKEGRRMRWNGGGKSSVYTEPKINGNHRTAKPPRLIARLIEDFSSKGDLILDPFAGGGVVPYVARLLGRRCVAIERDPQRCEAIVRWLEQGTLPRIPRKTKMIEGATLFDEVA